jgi:hypothetical protein
MHRPETKIKKEANILCNKPWKQNQVHENECTMDNLWKHIAYR